MNGLNYGAEGELAALKERLRTNEGELHRYCGLGEATDYRIKNSNDGNEIKELKNDIDKYEARISSLEADSFEHMSEVKKIEERIGT